LELNPKAPERQKSKVKTFREVVRGEATTMQNPVLKTPISTCPKETKEAGGLRGMKG